MSNNILFPKDHKHQSFLDVYTELIAELKQNGKYEATYSFRRSDGKIIRVKIVSILDTSNADHHRIISFHKDITKEFEAKEALKKRNIDLQKYIESNIQLEQFAHIASHDLRAPIINHQQFLKTAPGYHSPQTFSQRTGIPGPHSFQWYSNPGIGYRFARVLQNQFPKNKPDSGMYGEIGQQCRRDI